VDSYADWQNHTGFPQNQYPKTCCPGMDESDQTVKCTQGTAGFQKEGCLAKLTNVIKDNISIIGGVGIGVAFIQVRPC
jgi:CD63 antigen